MEDINVMVLIIFFDYLSQMINYTSKEEHADIVIYIVLGHL